MRLIRQARFVAVLVWVTGCALVLPAMANPLLLADMNTGEVLIAQDAGQPWHPASLTKLMTAFVTFNAIANGKVTLDTPVIMSAHALSMPPAKVGFPVGTAVTMEDALNLLIVKSANDMAVAIAETVSGSEEAFVNEMNQMAGVLGLSGTHFVDPNGLSEDGQYTTARDLALLTMDIQRYYSQYMPIFGTSVVQVGGRNLRTNNDLLTHFSGTTGMKTGFICAAGLNMVATVNRNGKRLVAVVLGASSSRERGERAAQMLLEGLNGQVQHSGLQVIQLANHPEAAPVNMRPDICGSEARDYVKAQEAAYPYGLEGEPSFLTDDIAGRSHHVTTLGRVREVPLPRPRPASAPQAVAQAAPMVPLPRPRPDL